jgi:3-isopropylmalate dehydrogenase
VALSQSHPNLQLITILSGPEVVAEAVKVLETIFSESPEVELKLDTQLFGGCAIDQTGEPLPASTLQACKEADAILMGT